MTELATLSADQEIKRPALSISISPVRNGPTPKPTLEDSDDVDTDDEGDEKDSRHEPRDEKTHDQIKSEYDGFGCICSCPCAPFPSLSKRTRPVTYSEDDNNNATVVRRKKQGDRAYAFLRHSRFVFLSGFSVLHYMHAICMLYDEHAFRDRVSAGSVSTETSRRRLCRYMRRSRKAVRRRRVEQAATSLRLRQPSKWFSPWIMAYVEALDKTYPNLMSAWDWYTEACKSQRFPYVFVQMRDSLSGLFLCMTNYEGALQNTMKAVEAAAPHFFRPEDTLGLLHCIVAASGLEVWRCLPTDVSMDTVLSKTGEPELRSVLMLQDCLAVDPYCRVSATVMYERAKSVRGTESGSVMDVHDGYTKGTCAAGDSEIELICRTVSTELLNASSTSENNVKETTHFHTTAIRSIRNAHSATERVLNHPDLQGSEKEVLKKALDEMKKAMYSVAEYPSLLSNRPNPVALVNVPGSAPLLSIIMPSERTQTPTHRQNRIFNLGLRSIWYEFQETVPATGERKSKEPSVSRLDAHAVEIPKNILSDIDDFIDV